MSLRVTGSQVIFPDQSELKTAPMGFGFKNRIINGDMHIAQRSTSVVVNNSTVRLYGGPDRWSTEILGAGGQVTQSQSTLTYSGNTKNTVRLTVNTPSTSLSSGNFWHGLLHLVEGVNCYDLAGATATLSFIFNTNVTGTYSVVISDGVFSSSYVTTINATANTPTKYSITLPISVAIPYSTNIGLLICIGFQNTGDNQTSALNTWVAGRRFSAAGATNWSATVGNFIEVTEVQLEKGATATDFDYRPYSVELALCQRYYEIGTSSWIGCATGSAVVRNYNKFAVVKRTSPSIVLIKAYSDNALATATPTVSTVSSSGFGVQFLTSGASTQSEMSADFYASAEL